MNRIILVTTLALFSLNLFADNPTETLRDPVQELMRYAGNIHQFNSIFSTPLYG